MFLFTYVLSEVSPWLLAIAREIKAPLMRIFAYWNIGCLDAADLKLLFWHRVNCKKAFNANKDFKYPKATVKKNLYNPKIILQNSNFHFKHYIYLTTHSSINEDSLHCLHIPEAHLYTFVIMAKPQKHNTSGAESTLCWTLGSYMQLVGRRRVSPCS